MRKPLLLLALFAAAGCSTGQSGTKPTSDAQLTAAGKDPAVLYVRAEPGNVVLDQEFEPERPVDILADIKDFDGRVDSARLRFTGIPLEIPMERAGGSTWRARLTRRQLELLAVSGRTVQYEALVVAKDDQGHTGMSKAPVSFSIQAPEIAGGVGTDERTSAAAGSQAGVAGD